MFVVVFGVLIMLLVSHSGNNVTAAWDFKVLQVGGNACDLLEHARETGELVMPHSMLILTGGANQFDENLISHDGLLRLLGSLCSMQCNVASVLDCHITWRCVCVCLCVCVCRLAFSQRCRS
jgi:hypothetical protein